MAVLFAQAKKSKHLIGLMIISNRLLCFTFSIVDWTVRMMQPIRKYKKCKQKVMGWGMPERQKGDRIETISLKKATEV